MQRQELSRMVRRMLGEPVRGPACAPPPASRVPAPAGAEAMEARLARLERGVRMIADAMARSHAELSAGLRVARSAAEEGTTPMMVREMLDEAIGPLSMSVERLAETVSGLPLALSVAPVPAESTMGLGEAPGASDGSQPQLTSEAWGDGDWKNETRAGALEPNAGDLPASPFDEPPDGVDESGDWFWNDRPDGEGTSAQGSDG